QIIHLYTILVPPKSNVLETPDVLINLFTQHYRTNAEKQENTFQNGHDEDDDSNSGSMDIFRLSEKTLLEKIMKAAESTRELLTPTPTPSPTAVVQPNARTTLLPLTSLPSADVASSDTKERPVATSPTEVVKQKRKKSTKCKK